MTKWKCQACGYQLEAPTPPEVCPSCRQKCEFVDNTSYIPDGNPSGRDDRIR